MDDANKLRVKKDPFLEDSADKTSSSSSSGGGGAAATILRNYYDEACNRLKQYLGKEEVTRMGSGTSSPRDPTMDGGVAGPMFTQRPMHCRLEGKQTPPHDQDFTDISYSDLGFIVTPQTKSAITKKSYMANGEVSQKDDLNNLNNNNNNNNTDSNISNGGLSSEGLNTPLHPATPPSSATPTSPPKGFMAQDMDCDAVSTRVAHQEKSSLGSKSRGNSQEFDRRQLPGATIEDAGDLHVEELAS